MTIRRQGEFVMEPSIPGAARPQDAPLPPWRIVAPPGSRLEQLLDQLGDARARADEAEAFAKSVADSIKAEVIPQAPRGTTSIIVAGTAYRPEFIVRWTETWRLDSKRLKAENLVTWVKYAVKGGTWKLEKARK
jgi:hypothetical protein